jgi:hypothetical protein
MRQIFFFASVIKFLLGQFSSGLAARDAKKKLDVIINRCTQFLSYSKTQSLNNKKKGHQRGSIEK